MEEGEPTVAGNVVTSVCSQLSPHPAMLSRLEASFRPHPLGAWITPGCEQQKVGVMGAATRPCVSWRQRTMSY